MKKTVLTVIASLLLTSIATAEISITKNMKLTADPTIAKYVDEPTSLDPADFLKAALLASGVTEAKMAGYIQKVEKIYTDYEVYRTTKNVKLNDAEAGIVYLYDSKVLLSYDFDQSSIPVLLDTGVYNCVSSAILYMYMMKRRGFKVIANETPDHVFCTVMDENGKQTDVETTSAFGFAPGRAKKINDASTGRSGTVNSEAEIYEERKKISGRRLINSIYSNRLIIEQQKAKPNNELLLQLVVDTTTLQKESKESIQEMYFNVGNVMYYLIQDNKYDEAMYVAKAFTDEYGHYGKSAYVTDRVASTIGKLYELHNSDVNYFGELLDEYGHCLSKEKYNIYYEKWVYDKVVDLVWNEDIPGAKALLQKGMKKLGFSEALSELQDQLDEANY